MLAGSLDAACPWSCEKSQRPCPVHSARGVPRARGGGIDNLLYHRK